MNDETFGVGTLAYFDTLCSGLVPCKVTEVREPGSGRQVTSGFVVAKVTAERGPYKRGELVHASAAYVVPRKMVRRSRGRVVVGVNYGWRRVNQ